MTTVKNLKEKYPAYYKAIEQATPFLEALTTEKFDAITKEDLVYFKKNFTSIRKKYVDWRKELAKVAPEIHNETEMGYASSISEMISLCTESVLIMASTLAEKKYRGIYNANLDWDKFNTVIKDQYDKNMCVTDLCYLTFLFLFPEYQQMMEKISEDDFYENADAGRVAIYQKSFLKSRESLNKIFSENVLSRDRKLAIENNECHRDFVLRYMELLPKCFVEDKESINKTLLDMIELTMKFGFESYNSAANSNWYGRCEGRMGGFLEIE